MKIETIEDRNSGPAASATRVTRLLDRANPHEIEAFERAFYTGFAHATHNRLVQWLWDWDHATRRLRAKVPYAEQEIWVMTGADGGITAAVSVNTALRLLQAAAYGFAVPADLESAAKAGKVCEFLTFFAVDEHSLVGKRALWRELFDDLRAAGFTHALSTTSPKIFPIHRWMGAEKIGDVQIEAETRYFLRFDLRQTTRRAAR